MSEVSQESSQAQDTPKPESIESEVKPQESPVEKPEGDKPEGDEIVFKGEIPSEENEPEKKDEQTDKPDAEALVEKYDLKLPDGAKLDAKEVEAIETFAKEQKLSKEAAQAILERENSFKIKQEAQMVETLNQKRTEWIEQSKADKVYGGERFSEFSEYATQAVEKFGGDDLKKIMNETGFGNHPVVFKTFAKIGKALQSDKIVRGKNADASRTKTLAELFYPNTKE